MSEAGVHNKATILLVDDARQTLRAVDTLVRRDDRRILLADSTDDAHNILLHNVVDLVIMSTTFNGDDGYAACRQIRSTPGIGDVPLLLVSTSGCADSRIAGIDAGADDVLVPPLDEPVLSARVQGILRLNRYRRSTEQAQLLQTTQDQLAQMRDSDPTTGLPNTELFKASVRRELDRARRADYPLAVLVVEVSDYDELLGVYGPAVMQDLTRAIADRLTDAVRGRAVIGRLDARCFSICQPLPRTDELTKAVHNYRRALAGGFPVGDGELELSTSIGGSLFPSDGDTDERLLGLALSAMSHARQMGRNRYHVLGPAARAEAKRRLDLETMIRQAIEREDLALHYQPRLRLGDGRVTGVEALLRIYDTNRNLVSPHVFMPIAEDSGLMERLGMWALERACADAITIMDAGFDLRMSVNIASNLFCQDTFLDNLRGVLKNHHLDGTGLELEVSENAIRPPLHGSLMGLQRLLANLKDDGITLSVDNFGTGYSCIDTLRHLPMDIVKIGQTFIAHVPGDTSLTAVVTSLINVGTNLGMRVVGQGVENAAQLSTLRDAGCHGAQGFLFARPQALQPLLESLGELIIDSAEYATVARHSAA